MKCTFCDREFTRKVNLDMHEKFCKSKKNDYVPNKGIKKVEKCEHDFILLNEKIPSHATAIRNGYNAVCSKCNELT
jgi:hypothetical protein